MKWLRNITKAKPTLIAQVAKLQGIEEIAVTEDQGSWPMMTIVVPKVGTASIGGGQRPKKTIRVRYK